MRAAAGVLVLAALAAPPPARAADPSPKVLKKQIDAVLGRRELAPAFWGVEVRSLPGGKVLYAFNAEKNLTPASTMKLVTTAAALDAFGPAARLRTTVEASGRLDGLGRVLGDVYLVGRGDANLSGRFTEGRITAAFEEMAEQLWSAGVRRVEGRVLGHEGLFAGDRRGADWAWEDLVWWYGAEVSALSFNDNSADLVVRPGERPGDPVLVERAPLSSYYAVASTAVTAPAGTEPTLTLSRDLGTNLIRITGAYPLAGKDWRGSVALEDPARYAATVFAEVLERRGIRVAGPAATARDPLPAGARVLASHDGPTMAEMLKAVNKPSQNLHAEMLLRLLGTRSQGDGSAAAGQAAVGAFLRRVGVRPDDWWLADGSGLSRSDLVSAHEMAALLVAMDRHPHARAFRDSLPVAGVDGTLKGRMRGTAAEGRVAAKTGTLRQAAALAGYVTTRGGARLAFALAANHHTAKGSAVTDAIDAIAAILAGS
jgi:serine-type D-Ala-D-Ala carboxypeptidase/endopeptidase (penicillin-binding protein 4)